MQQKNKPLQLSILSLAICGALAGVPAFAHTFVETGADAAEPASKSEAEKRKDEGAEVLEVTARRMSERIQDVPVAVTALSEAKIADMGAQTLVDLERSVPNLTVNASRGTNSTITAYLRGVGQNDPLWGYEPGVGLYIDDVYIARPQGGVLDILDIQRVEVLRGPQGTLYGKNTMGGAIKYVTRELPDYTRGQIEIGVGDYSQRDIKAGFSTPVVEDKLLFGISAAKLSRDGFGQVVEGAHAGKDLSDKDITAARINLTWLASDSVKVKFIADDVQDDSNARGGQRLVPSVVTKQPPLPGRYDTRQNMDPENNEVSMSGQALTISWDINEDWQFKSVTAQREGSTRSDIDFDQINLPVLDIPAWYDDEQFSQEFQFSYSGEKLSLVSGLYYFDGEACGKFDTVLGILFGVGGAGFARETSGCVDTTSQSLYAQGSYRISEQLSFTLGGRYDEDEKSATVVTQNFMGMRSSTGTPISARGVFSGSETFDDFSPRVGLEYKINPDLMTYVSYSHGFKSGGFNMRGNILLDAQAGRPFQPETVDTYELGLKGSWLDRRVMLYAALFTQDYQDKQVTVNDSSTGTPLQRVLNAAQASGDGLELELSARLTDDFAINLVYGYLDAKYDEFVGSITPGGAPVDISHLVQMINSPEQQYSIGFSYEMQMGAGRLMLLADYNWRDDTYIFEAVTPVDQSAYSLYNASAVFYPDNSNWRFALHGRNLGDEAYRTGGYNFPATGGDNTVTAYYGDPRTWTLTAAYSF